MMKNVALNVAAVVFLTISVVQLLRVIFRVKVTANERIIPLWLSMIASPAMLLLAIYMFIAARR